MPLPLELQSGPIKGARAHLWTTLRRKKRQQSDRQRSLGPVAVWVSTGRAVEGQGSQLSKGAAGGWVSGVKRQQKDVRADTEEREKA